MEPKIKKEINANFLIKKPNDIVYASRDHYSKFIDIRNKKPEYAPIDQICFMGDIICSFDVEDFYVKFRIRLDPGDVVKINLKRAVK